MTPKFRTVFAQIPFLSSERVALASEQFAKQRFIAQKVDACKFSNRMLVVLDFILVLSRRWPKVEHVGVSHFLGRVAKHAAEFGIRFRNLAIEMANSNSNRRGLKYCLQAGMAFLLANRGKVTYDVHDGPFVTGGEKPARPLQIVACCRYRAGGRLRFQGGKNTSSFPRTNRDDPD